MHDHIPTLDELDRDGALQETAAKAGITRSQLLRRSAFAGGGLIVGGLPAAFALAQNLSKGDVEILNYALTLEYLEAAFYRDAVERGALRGRLARFAEIVGEHEQAHVDALKQTLGSRAVKQPRFDFKGTTDNASTFGDTAKVLEDTGVRAYQGQVTNIKAPAILKAAVAIHPVEARHAAWIASILARGSGSPSPAPDAFSPAADMRTILSEVQATGFVTTERGASPSRPVTGTPTVAG